MSQNDFSSEHDVDKIDNGEISSEQGTDEDGATLSAKEQFQHKMAMFKKARAQQNDVLGVVPDQILSEVETEQDAIAGQIFEKEESKNTPIKPPNQNPHEKVQGIMQRAQQERDDKLSQEVREKVAQRSQEAGGGEATENTNTEENTNPTEDKEKKELPPPPPPINAEVEVKIADSELSASVLVIPPEHGGLEITAEAIKEALDKKEVTFGVAVLALKKIASQRLYNQWVEVAVGKPLVNGTNGAVTLHVNIHADAGPRQNEDGTVDYKELGIINNVVTGDILATATLPTEGEPGMSVKNRELIQKPGVPAKLPAGSGTQVLEDGLTLIAAVDGNLEYRNNAFTVTQVFEIKGNVDNSTGNINFVGSVRVTGDVRAGFSIVSGGDIKVNGMVEGAILEAAGNISVDTGINGMGTGKIVAMGEVKAKFIESCDVETGGNLYAEAIINSEVKCDGDLIMTKGKGAIMGGNLLVAKNLTAISIGSISNIATNVTIGYTARLTEKITAARKNLENMQNDIVKLDQVILYLTDLYNKGTITPQRYELLKQSIYSRNAKAEEMDLLNIELMAMEEEFNAPTTSILKCSGIINPGVKINISNYTYRVSTEISKCMLYLADDGIVVGQG